MTITNNYYIEGMCVGFNHHSCVFERCEFPNLYSANEDKVYCDRCSKAALMVLKGIAPLFKVESVRVLKSLDFHV